jgi:hypothetical protein
MHYLRMYASADGASHFADGEAELLPVEFVPGRPLVDLSAPTPASATAFAHLPAGWAGDYHPSPRRQLVVPVRGEMVVTASDGETRRIGPGTVWLLEDTSGTGHLTRVPDTEDFVGVLVWLAS